jgi:hypothetical protein
MSRSLIFRPAEPIINPHLPNSMEASRGKAPFEVAEIRDQAVRSNNNQAVVMGANTPSKFFFA